VQREGKTTKGSYAFSFLTCAGGRSFNIHPIDKDGRLGGKRTERAGSRREKKGLTREHRSEKIETRRGAQELAEERDVESTKSSPQNFRYSKKWGGDLVDKERRRKTVRLARKNPGGNRTGRVATRKQICLAPRREKKTYYLLLETFSGGDKEHRRKGIRIEKGESRVDISYRSEDRECFLWRRVFSREYGLSGRSEQRKGRGGAERCVEEEYSNHHLALFKKVTKGEDKRDLRDSPPRCYSDPKLE